MMSLLALGFGVLILILAIVLTIYIVMGIYLNKLHEIEYGKKTCFAWIPVLNFYLLGKLAINKFFGWMMILGFLLTGSFSSTINDVEKTVTILPEPFYTIFSYIYGAAILAFLVVVIVKCHKKKIY